MMNISHLPSVSGMYNRQVQSSDIKSEKIKPKNNTSLPDNVYENIQRMAKEDAKKNIYMDSEFVSYINKYKAQHISPNRSGLMMMLSPMIANAQYTNGQPTFFSMMGFSVRYSVGAVFGAYISVRDSSGAEILSYSPPPNGGWVSFPTKEENEFHDEATSVYCAAYDKARAEIKAQQTGSVEGAATAGFNATV